jgi:hypothetical protein
MTTHPVLTNEWISLVTKLRLKEVQVASSRMELGLCAMRLRYSAFALGSIEVSITRAWGRDMMRC